MDAIKGFFTKYHAVPAGDRGPDWKAASLESLLGWLDADLRLYDGGQRDPHFVSRMRAIRDELRRRSCLSADPQIATAYRAACERVGPCWACGGRGTLLGAAPDRGNPTCDECGVTA